MFIKLFFIVSLTLCSNANNRKVKENEFNTEFLAAHETFGYEPLMFSDVPNALNSYITDSTGGQNWEIDSSFSVANVNGGIPNDIVNMVYDRYGEEVSAPGPFSEARQELFNDSKKYVGCGINALYSELEYFSLYGHFDGIGIDENNQVNFTELAKFVIENTETVTIGDELFISPTTIHSTFNETMTHFGYNNLLYLKIGVGTPNDFISSINEGYPIIWGCALDGEIAKAHYLVVYAYEQWRCVDSDGNAHSQIMFKTRYNWYYDLETGPIDSYIHPDMFNYINLALYPHRMRNHYIFNDSDITNECYYPFTFTTNVLNTLNGDITCDYLRTGYVIDNNGEHYLTMSARRTGAGIAQIVLTFPETISEIYWKYSLWGSNEWFNFSTDSFVLEGKNYDDSSWSLIDNLPLYLITIHRDNPDRYHKLFDDAYVSIRITLTTSAIGDRNKGRVIFKDIMAFGNHYIDY